MANGLFLGGAANALAGNYQPYQSTAPAYNFADERIVAQLAPHFDRFVMSEDDAAHAVAAVAQANGISPQDVINSILNYAQGGGQLSANFAETLGIGNTPSSGDSFGGGFNGGFSATGGDNSYATELRRGRIADQIKGHPALVSAAQNAAESAGVSLNDVYDALDRHTANKSTASPVAVTTLPTLPTLPAPQWGQWPQGFVGADQPAPTVPQSFSQPQNALTLDGETPAAF